MSELSWQELVEQVGQWSRRNFDDQQSRVRPTTHLHELAPLLGLVEEVAYEFNEAGRGLHKQGQLDALADATIFLADFWYRSEGDPQKFQPAGIYYRTFGDLVSHAGRLCHFVLKAHQGIRYSQEEVAGRIEELVQELLIDLDSLSRQLAGVPILALTNTVWQKVRQRDWKKDALTAGEKSQGCGKCSCDCSG